MYKKFSQWLEAIQHDNTKSNSLIEILQQLTHEDKVKFALICAEEVLPKEGLASAKHCIDLVKKWLENHNSVARQKLIDAAYVAYTDANTFSYDSAIIIATAYVAYSVYGDTNSSTYSANAVYYARQISGKPESYYIKLARSFLSKTDNKNPMYKSFLDKPDLSSIMAMLDYAEEDNENIVIHKNNEFIFNSHDHILKANSKRELAELIMKNKWALDYLQRLYPT